MVSAGFSSRGAILISREGKKYFYADSHPFRVKSDFKAIL